MDLHQILLAATEVVQEAAETTAHAEESSGILGTLGINWKLFLAQLFNFAIVLFVFWKWIFGPISSSLIARQDKIEKSLQNAEMIEKEKRQLATDKIEEMRVVRQEAEKIIKSATDTAKKMKEEIITEAQSQSSKMMEQTKAQMVMEKQTMLKEVKQDVAGLVVEAAEKILREKLDSKKDHELIMKAIKK